MKKTIPLKKDLTFKNNLAEITSIALDHDLILDEDVIKGDLVVSGSYKINDISINTEEFKFNIPVNIEMSNRYILDELIINIDDFYYEIVNSNVLNVSIEIGLDKLKEIDDIIPPIKCVPEMIVPVNNEIEERSITIEANQLEENISNESEIMEEKKEDRLNPTDVKSLFDNFDDSKESYATYKVCIVKESETIDSIMIKYAVTKETLEQYNDLTDVKIGDKLIIPSMLNETS